MTATSFGFTAHFAYIDAALRARWDSFRALEEEMNRFVPKPLANFTPHRDAELERMRALNPDMSMEQLTTYVDQQVRALASHDFQFHDRFDQRHMTEYVTVVMLSHALSEALINAILAIGLANAGAAELFPLLERSDFKQKWLSAPKSFATSYKFPHGTALYETLVLLSRQRNALVHLKINLDVNGAKVLDGSGFERKPYREEARWLRRFFSLPYDLADYASKTIAGVPLMFLPDRSPIEIAHAHNAA